MRKTVIALMIILPLLFVLIIFTAGTAASLNTTVAANGIEILGKPDNGILSFDYATYNDDYEIRADVKPANASNKEYTFKTEAIEDADFADIEVVDNRIKINSLGSARLVVTSNDGNYTDSVNIVAGSSRPVDFSLEMKPFVGGDDPLVKADNGYVGNPESGKYYYKANITPAGFSGVELTLVEGNAVVDPAAGTVLLPFSGKVKLRASIDGAKGEIVKTVELDVKKQATNAGFTVDGSEAGDILLRAGTRNAAVYIETDGTAPVLSGDSLLGTPNIIEMAAGKYRVEMEFAAGGQNGDRYNITVTVGGNSEEITFEFAEFDFGIRTDLPNDSDEITILAGRDFTFFAYPLVSADGIVYRWNLSDNFEKTISEDGGKVVLSSEEYGNFSTTVEAYDGEVKIAEKTFYISVIREITSIQLADNFDVGLAKHTVVPQRVYVNGVLELNKLAINLITYRVDKIDADGLRDLDIETDDAKIAAIKVENGKIYLEPKGSGEVRITAAWRGNEAFGANVRTGIRVTVVMGAVGVDNAEDFMTAVRNYPVVLNADIMLGTDRAGNVLSEEDRQNLVKTVNSTYNVDFYKNSGKSEEAKIKYIVQISHDLYGNGHFINAEYISNLKDGSSGKGKIFDGPLKFVQYGEIVSVAGQDNASFLIRGSGSGNKNPINIYNVTLMGCSDESLVDEGKGQADLTLLNKVGTVLDINGSVNLKNCRIRNGRNAVRAYGGNYSGNSYFVNSLSGKEVSDERIYVNIEGCIISQAREFLVKIGANRALRATASNLSNGKPEPSLTNAAGQEYSTSNRNLYLDEYFYSHYVMTDVTIADTVLENCGLFSVGIESNFSGDFLYDDGGDGIKFRDWGGTGGTSFASVLRLKGDVRIYDWKRLDLVDSSTLIEFTDSSFGETEGVYGLRLNIEAMLELVCAQNPEEYGNILAQYNDENGLKKYVHGGIAFYGGGKNYSQLVVEDLNAGLSDYSQYLINIDILATANPEEGQSKEEREKLEMLKAQGELLPKAAGTQDFRFYMYGNDSANNYEKQKADSAAGTKYVGIKALKAF